MTGDQALMRTAIAQLIAAEQGLSVIAECVNRSDAIAAAMSATPDLVVMDLDVSSERSETIAQLLAVTGRCPVLLVTADDHCRSLANAFSDGLRGVVLKSRPAVVLVKAVKAVLAGEVWLEPSTLANVFGTSPPKRRTHDGKLTTREREIAELVSLGLSNKTIAGRLYISETTVRHHLTSIFTKLDVKSRLELMRLAYSGGLELHGTFVPPERDTELSFPPMRSDR
ncbi:MAG TPA: response regulator transcription factor [Thermoanaerobaculia bacterium]